MHFTIARRLRRLLTHRSRISGHYVFNLADLRRYPRSRNEAIVRALARSAYLGQGDALCRVLGRYKMVVDTQDNGLSPHLLLDGYWEMWVTEVMAARVRQGMTAIDVGANLGYFTLLLADMVGPAGRVHAFEPNPPIAARLRRSLSLNGFDSRTTVHEIALADRAGEMDLIIPEREPKNAFLAAPGSGRGAVARVAARRLDSWPEFADADFIKIDADMAEEAIWRGAAGLLALGRPMTVVLEFAPARYADPGGFLAAIVTHGFTLNLIDPEAGVQPTAPGALLNGSPHDDRMLLLCR